MSDYDNDNFFLSIATIMAKIVGTPGAIYYNYPNAYAYF